MLQVAQTLRRVRRCIGPRLLSAAKFWTRPGACSRASARAAPISLTTGDLMEVARHGVQTTLVNLRTNVETTSGSTRAKGYDTRTLTTIGGALPNPNEELRAQPSG